jgi:cell division ATPase FtsA
MPREAHRSELIEVLEARADQLLSFGAPRFSARMDRSLLEGVLLTGGGAMLPGMWDMAEKKLDRTACLGWRRESRLARGTAQSRVGDCRRAGDVFGQVEIAPRRLRRSRN